MKFLGIDLGTSAVKIIVMDDNGNICGSVSKEYPVYYPKPGFAEQNPEDWWEAVVYGIREITANHKIDVNEIRGIGLSGQMHGLVTLDKDSKVLMPAILWCDQRTAEECDYLNNVVGRERISELTGNMALTGFTAPKLLWVRKNRPDIYEKIAHVMLPKDYINFKFTGNYCSDVSDASGTLMFDVKNRKWSEEMLDIIGIDKSVLPQVFESWQIIGKLNSQAAEATGLSMDTAVAAGAGDQAAGAVGTGIVESGILSVALGTSGVVFASSEEYYVDKDNRLHSFCHSNGKWHQMGVMLSAASCLKWWVESINDKLPGDRFDILLKEAECSPVGSNGIVFLPYLMGERTPHSDPNAKGTFIGLNITNNRADMTKSILEGVCFGLRDSLEILKDMNIPVKRARVSGGGAKSRLWRHILADIFNTDVEIINSEEGPAFGGAILASVGCGLFGSVDEACKSLIKVVEVVKPHSENVQKYNKVYKVYTGLYYTLKNTFTLLSEI